MIPNEEGLDPDLGQYLVKTYDAEQYIGGRFWDRVSGGDLHKMKGQKGTMWDIADGDAGMLTKKDLMKMREKDVVALAKEMGLTASVEDRKEDTVDAILAHSG